MFVELAPLTEPGNSINISGSIKTFRLGRKEVGKSLGIPIRKVSRDHLTFLVQSETEIKMRADGRNGAFYGKFEQPLGFLPKGESSGILLSGDVIAFRKCSYVYRIVIGANKPADESTTNGQIETLVGEDELEEWSSGSDVEKRERESRLPPDREEVERRLPCEFGATCYRRNPVHKRERSHPGDPDWWDPIEQEIENDPRPECEFGIVCYQKNEIHRRAYKHTSCGKPPRKRRAARNAEETTKKVVRELGSDEEFSLSESENEWEDDGTDGTKSDKEVTQRPLKLSAKALELLNESKRILRDNNF